jgi:hypothetical protein
VKIEITVEFLGEPTASRIVTMVSTTCKRCSGRIALTGFNDRLLWEHIPHHGPFPNTHCPSRKGHVCRGDSCRGKHAAPLIRGDAMKNNATIRLMKENHIPVTRENYLLVEYLGTPSAEVDAEVEGELPRPFRKWPRTRRLRLTAEDRLWLREIKVKW